MSLFTRDHEVEDPDVERTVRIARQRFVRRQWARRWLAWRRVVVAVLLLAVVVGSLWLVFFSSALAVQGVKVEGTQVLDPRVVRRAAAVPTGTPLASVDLDAIAQRVALLDDQGVMFRRYPSRPHSLPLIRMSGHARPDALAEAAKVAGSLPSSIAAKVDYVEVRTVDTISLRLRSGKPVRWGTADDSAAKARVLAVLLGQKASSIDVSVPGQPVITR